MNNKGSKYYNNGIKNLMIKDGDSIPEGFVPGMVKRSKEDKEKSNQKRKETNLKKYGGPAPLSSSEVRDKARQTNIEKYGVDNPGKSAIVKLKRESTLLERYGVTNPMKSDVIVNNIKKSVKMKYGVDNVFQNESVKEKIKQSCLDRYGVEHPLQNKDILEKAHNTIKEKYGVEHALQSEELNRKKESTLFEHYGVVNPMQSDVLYERQKDALFENYGVTNPMDSDVIKDRIKQTNLERYGVSCTFFLPNARVGNTKDSKPNLAFKEILDKNSISYEREFCLNRRFYDFKVGNYLIEIDPFPTHNVLWNPFSDKNEAIDKDYHYNKSHTAEEKGYQCIHVFDWDDVDKVIEILKPKTKIYARKCIIKEVSIDDTSEFINKYHLQGMCRGQDIRLGLYYQGTLVSIMTFGKPRYNKNYEYELLRYCSSCDIVGGAEKLFKYFIKTYNPKSVISYCDRSKFVGKVYEKLGFILKTKGKPSKHWYSPKEKNHITDNLLRQRGYDQLFNEGYGKGTSNEELIIDRGYLPIYDCGQDVWVYGGAL